MTSGEIREYARATYAETRRAQGLPLELTPAQYDRIAALMDVEPERRAS